MGMLRRFRRSRILRSHLLPDDAWAWLLEEHPILAGLDDGLSRSLREMASLFLAEKDFEAAEGLDLTDDMCAVIAVQACLPVAALGIEYLDGWRSTVVLPGAFVAEQRVQDAAGVVHEWDEDDTHGQAGPEGPVTLSWKQVEESGWGDGYNVVIHEAAHVVDLLDGDINGCPALHEGMDPVEWRDVFSRGFAHFARRVKKRRGRTPLDPYAVEDEGEFFAVMSEHFFEQPALLAEQYPDVYRLLSAWYRQDPRGRARPSRRRR